MRDRVAERAVAGALHVDVDPLVVAAALGKLIDARLGDAHGARESEIATDMGGQRDEGVVMGFGHHGIH